MTKYVLGLLIVGLACNPAHARARDYLKRPDAWFASDEARQIAGNILSHQSDLGGWPKNTDTTAVKYAGDQQKLQPTFDNGATTDELRFLSRIYNATRDQTYHRAFDKGLRYILAA